ncbi:hypothetical protein O3G_MSEX012321 [Manduca sexta]|uniref:G-protein coupled receptors family 1 profile domain-containing protein n=1 Tax=Manduca sexta TaxID=7130 RepID=A0A921ZNV8_MANSE|nr:hypothetical protein O3G_MSEX012321 [Manduca sexta]
MIKTDCSDSWRLVQLHCTFISVTNIFLVNLSVADLLVTLFCMPVQIAKAVTVLWYFGEVMCKTLNFLQGVAVASSVFTITAMSVDRYLAITQSLRQPWMPSRRGACALLAALWLVAFAIFAPLLAVAAVERERVPLLSRTRNGSILNLVFYNFGIGTPTAHELIV